MNTAPITTAAETIAFQRHPEAFNDPTVQAATTPEARQAALSAYLKTHDASYDPNNVYKTTASGGITPNTGSWFSDHLPLITGLMGSALGGAGLLAGGAAGGAGAAADLSLNGVEGGASGLTDAGLSGLGTGAMGAAGTAGAAAGTGAFDAAGNFIGDSTYNVPAGGGILNGASNLLTGGKGFSSPGGILNAAGRIGGALSGIEADRQAGRQAEANATNAQDRNKIAAEQVNLTAPNARLSSSIHGDIAANAKDFSYGAPTMVGNIPVPTSTGGLRPSIFSQNTRNLGALTSQEALADETADGGKPAGVTPLPAATSTDSILGTAGTIASLMGALPYKAPNTQPVYYMPPGYGPTGGH